MPSENFKRVFEEALKQAEKELMEKINSKESHEREEATKAKLDPVIDKFIDEFLGLEKLVRPTVDNGNDFAKAMIEHTKDLIEKYIEVVKPIIKEGNEGARDWEVTSKSVELLTHIIEEATRQRTKKLLSAFLRGNLSEL